MHILAKMKWSFKKIIKYFLDKIPFAFTKNQEYDLLTEKIILKTCSTNSLCVDIGSHDGKILKLFIKHCPKKMHYAFEPIPSLYALLKRKYGSASKIYSIALSNKKGKSTFQHIITNTAYSGLKKRELASKDIIKEIDVEMNLLDNIILPTDKIDLIKLDIEGGEYEALEGASNTIIRCKPIILFEFGKGAANYYDVSPEKMYQLFRNKFQYQINTLQGFLNQLKPITIEDFTSYYSTGKEYFFIAYSTIK